MDVTRDELAAQVRQRLESLRAAGVEWLPAGEPLNSSITLAESMASNVEAGQPVPPPESLFAEPSAPSSNVPIAERRQSLQMLAKTVAGCTRCSGLASTRTQTVFGVGAVGADVCFIGEAPGADEDAQGEPFVGAAGQLLNRIITACGMKREEVYICNIIKCRPPGNRTPQPDEAANCNEYLIKQLELVAPKYICCLGATAAKYLLNTTAPIGKLRGQFHEYRGIPVICTYHPAYLLPHRSPDKKKDVWEDMKMLLRRMGLPIPS